MSSAKRCLTHGQRLRMASRNMLRACGVGKYPQIDHEQPSSVSTTMWQRPLIFLPGVVTSRLRRLGLDRLAVDDASRGARRAAGAFAVDHQRHIVNGFEQKAAHEAAKPPVDGLPRRKIFGSIRQPQPARAI